MIDLAKNIIIRTTEFSAENKSTFQQTNSAKNRIAADVVIMTATPQEFDSITSELANTKEIDIKSNDSNIYYESRVSSLNGELIIILPFPNGMGIEAAVNSTAKAISHFSPDLVIMSGICAGNKNVTQIGDLIIAEKTINYGNVVEIEKEGTVSKKKFMQTADSINKNLKARLTLFSTSQTFKNIIETIELPRQLKRNPKCQLGLVVTGSTLMRSDEKMKEINDSYHGVKAMDMETHGVYFASSNSNKDKNPLFVSMKSVSDYGDNSYHIIDSETRTNLALQISAKSVISYIREHYRK
jgi:nucleoside phosphorylase